MRACAKHNSRSAPLLLGHFWQTASTLCIKRCVCSDNESLVYPSASWHRPCPRLWRSARVLRSPPPRPYAQHRPPRPSPLDSLWTPPLSVCVIHRPPRFRASRGIRPCATGPYPARAPHPRRLSSPSPLFPTHLPLPNPQARPINPHCIAFPRARALTRERLSPPPPFPSALPQPALPPRPLQMRRDPEARPRDGAPPAPPPFRVRPRVGPPTRRPRWAPRRGLRRRQPRAPRAPQVDGHRGREQGAGVLGRLTVSSG